MFHGRVISSCGEDVTTFYPQRRMCTIGRLSRSLFVLSAKWRSTLLDTFFGVTRCLLLCGLNVPDEDKSVPLPKGIFLAIFHDLSSWLEVSELELMAITAHKLWTRRNRIVFGGKLLPLKCLVIEARESLSEFQQIRSSLSCPVVVVVSPCPSLWEKPPIDWIKMNWDAVLDKAKKVMGVGLRARDFKGRVRACMCSHIPYIFDPSMAEAFASRTWVELLKATGFQKLRMEGDAKMVVEALNSNGLQSTCFGSIVDNTRLLLQSIFECRVSYVNRNCNVVAHRLACLAAQQGFHRVWIESFPDLMSKLVCTEHGSSP
jgi:hypothetical protein